MKKTLIFIASLLVIALGCVFAFTAFANNECEHTDNWVVSVGSEGLLGEINFANICPSCGVTVASESYACMFDTLGYSYSDNGGITQHYGVDRDVVARYEELTGETVKFGVVTATRNHVAGNPINSNGTPVSNKVVAVDFTDTVYDVFDVIVTGIPEGNFDNTEIICCAYVIVNGEVSYIDSDAQVKNAPAYTFNKVKQNHTNGISGTTDVEAYKVVNGERYRTLTDAELGLAVGGYWNSSDANYKYITKTKTGADLAAKFAYTPHLTKDSLPNGAIITIESGWQYRPEGWVNGAKNTSRPGNVTTSTVLVNDAWWGEYTTRAFNISKTSNSIIYGNTTVEDVSNIFNVYVPVSAEIPANPIPLKQAWDEDGSLKILTIGNSYSDDAMEYVYNIAKELGIENVEVANLRANSCSLATHLSNAQNDTGYYMYRHWANGDNKWVDQGSWSSNGTYKISTAVTDADWDYIVFQQVSTSSTDASTYDDLNALIEIVEELNPTARYAWHMTWGDKTVTDLSMYNSIVSAVQSKIVGNEKIDVIVPVGTTIQNLRTSYLSLDDIMRNKHLGYGIGRYAAGLTFVKALTGKAIDTASIPTADTEGHTFDYSPEMRHVVYEAVNNAIANPFEVTESTMTELDARLADLSLIDNNKLNLTKSSYYNKNAGEFYFEPLSGEKWKEVSTVYDYGRYFATKMFTKETLPVGSIIYVTSGYKYFVESWELDENGTPIAGTGTFNSRFSATGTTSNSDASAFVSTQYVVIDEAWWEGKDIVAFNIGNTQTILSGVEIDDIGNVFKLYVPKDAIAKNEAGATDAEGNLYDPTPYDKPAYAPEDLIVDSNGKVKKEAINFEASTVINGKTYYALTLEEMAFEGGFYNCYDNTGRSYTWVSTYTSARIFGQDELLNGMYIWTKKNMKADGWTVEGEFYKGAEGYDIGSGSARSGEYAVKDATNGDYIEITDEWWSQKIVGSDWADWFTEPEKQGEGPFVLRGMYIRNDGSTVEKALSAYNYFRIYVPEDMIAE